MKKCIPLIIFIFFFNSFLNSQNMQVIGGEAIEQGIYLSSDPILQDGVFYYTKTGSPNLFLYRNTVFPFIDTWYLGTTLGSVDLATIYHHTNMGSGRNTPDGLLFGYAGDLGDPFFPVVVNDTPLPVELTSFTIDNTLEGVVCKWTTESEIENLGFMLERKTEGMDWSKIASYKTNDGLLGQGTSSSYTDYEYLDAFVEPNNTYKYRLADVDYNGVVTYHATRAVTVEKAPLSSKIDKFTVLPAYPNPFNPSTTITFGLADVVTRHALSVQIQIYDITGKLITTLLNEEQSPGWHSVIWNGKNQNGEQAPAGLYLSRIVAGNDVKTSKLMFLK